MKRLLIFLMIFCAYLSAAPDNNECKQYNPITNLQGLPSSIVAGHVNVITGDLCFTRTDMVIPGPEPITLSRAYCSSDMNHGSLYRSWNMNLLSYIERYNQQIEDYRSKSVAKHVGAYGSAIPYEAPFKNGTIHRHTLSEEAMKRGITNTAFGVISGRTNLANTMVQQLPNDSNLIMITPAGEVHKFISHPHFILGYPLDFVKTKHHTHRRYTYQHRKYLERVETYNSKHDPLSHLEMKYISKNTVDAFSSDGQKIVYRFAVGDHGAGKGEFLTCVYGKSVVTEKYGYQKRKNSFHLEQSVIASIERPDNRFLRISYIDESDYPKNTGFYVARQMVDRVKTLSAPVGRDATPIVTHRFVYHIDTNKLNEWSGSTDVYDCFNNKKTYIYNGDHRLLCVHRFIGTEDHQHYNTERYHWGGPDPKSSTLLNSITVEDNTGSIFACKAYRYDDRGNVLSECLYGNITGNSDAPITLDDQGYPIDNGNEYEGKLFEYSNDALNLVTRAVDARKDTRLAYYKDSELLRAKWILDHEGNIWVRHFFFYDESGVKIKEITDDGSSWDCDDLTGVTERRITTIIPSFFPVIGLPEEIKETYLDLATGEEQLVKRTLHEYNERGFLISRDTYGSDGSFAYSEQWTYNDRGQVQSKSDPEGRMTMYQYDANGNLVLTKTLSVNFSESFIYDYSNRLIKRTIQQNGQKISTRYGYDYMGLLTEETDPYGNTTHHCYDSLGRKYATRAPATYDQHGNPVADETFYTYDVLGNLTSQKDALGVKTIARSTLHGAPAHIIHADGTTETFQYNTDGTLAYHTAKNGAVTEYTYDIFGRQCSVTTSNADGVLLSKTIKEYDRFHLRAEYDANGNATHYRYDGAGRLIEKSKDNSTTTYSYDTLGRQSRITEGNLVTAKTYDNVGNVLVECKETTDGALLQRIEKEYDDLNRVIKTTTFGEEGPSVTTLKYDAFSNPIETVDPLGNATCTQYKYNYRNDNGQCVPYKEITDPQGKKTVVIGDARSRDSSILVYNNLGVLLNKSQIFYNSRGNKTAEKHTIISNGEEEKTITTLWEYDSEGRCIKVTEAAGTSEQRSRTTAYNSLGLKACVTKADGVLIYYHYDDLGRCYVIQSTDGTVHYYFERDANGNITRAIDCINNTQSYRSYDAYDRLLDDTLNTGLTLSYTYDANGRIASFTLPDQSSIHYTYDGLHLTAVERRDPFEDTRYIHRYTSYDLSGRVLSQLRIDNNKKTTRYDPCGRISAITTPGWSETLEYDAVGHIVAADIDTIPHRYQYDDLGQLTNESGNATHEYRYDSMHNLLEKDGVATTLNAHHQVTRFGQQSLTYDPNGNLTTKGDLTLHYDALDRLTHLITPTAIYRYTYDDLNRRIAKTHYSAAGNIISEERYLYEGLNEIGLCDADDTIVQLRILGKGLGAEIGASIAIEIDSQPYIPQHDHNGNIVALIDWITGDTIESYHYSAFGQREESPALTPWRFSSKRHDPESSFIYFGRRYYDPQLGRWISKDPLGNPDGPNRYAYVHNNPLIHVDLYGLCLERRDSPLLEHFLNWNHNIERKVGRFIENTAYHVLPCGPSRHCIEGAGRYIQGESFSHDYTGIRDSHSGIVGSRSFFGCAVRYISGILTTPSECEEDAKNFSAMLADHEVRWTCQPAAGGFTDLCDSATKLAGAVTDNIRHLATQIQSDYDELRQRSDNPTIYLSVHSRGSVDLYNATKLLSKEVRACLNIITLGSPIAIPREDFQSAKNYVNNSDIVAKINNFSSTRKDAEIIMTGFSSGGMFSFITDHYISSEGYQEVLESFTDVILEKQGIVNEPF
ncbi:MAG: RHS repeat protein [Chlamydiales bacterium]|nr:RHS repeat protein [Chlamydiales bacterium]